MSSRRITPIGVLKATLETEKATLDRRMVYWGESQNAADDDKKLMDSSIQAVAALEAAIDLLELAHE